MVSTPNDVVEQSWSGLVQRVWQQEGGISSERYDFEVAALNDAVRTLRPLFAPLLAHLTGWAASRIANPLRRHFTHKTADRDCFLLPVGLPEMQQRLEHRLGIVLRSRLSGYHKFLVRLESLEQEIGFKPITKIESLGDTHVFGDGVRGVTFQNGRRYIYKPRSANAEFALGHLSRLWTEGLDLVPMPFSTSCDCCWWTEVPHLPSGALPSNTRMFGRRYGQALALATALAWDDLHYENVLACMDGESVALIDTETAWGNQLPINTDKLEGLSPVAWLGLRTHMLPSPIVYDQRLFENSPLSKFLIRAQEDTRDVWDLAQRSGFIDFQYLLPRDASWFSTLSQGVVEGIAETSARIRASNVATAIEHSGITALQTRFVYRPTRTYYGMLRDAILREVSLGTDFGGDLWNALFEETASKATDPEAHHHICCIELEFLLDGSIPIFWTDKDGALISNDEVVKRDFRTDLARKGTHIRNLSDETAWQQLQHLSILQIDQLRKVSCSAAPYRGLEFNDRDPAEAVATELIDCAVHSSNGQLIFLDFAPTGNMGEWGSQIVGRGLYRGAAGIGLALWATDQHAGKTKTEQAWRACFADATAALGAGSFADMAAHSWSMSDGVFGIAYVLSVIESKSGVADAIRVALDAALLDSDLSDWNEWDFIGGWAGALACYAAIARRTDNPSLGEAGRRLCSRFKDVLTETVLSSSYRTEPSHRGLAHGVAGAVYAIGMARMLWPDVFTERLFDDTKTQFAVGLTLDIYEDWPNAGTWCGGASGVIRAFRRLGRCAPSLPSWFLRAAQSETAALEQLCCGRLGRMLAAAENQQHAGRDFIRQGKILLARAAAPDFVSFEAVGGSFRSLGFFQGVAGALYYGVHMQAGILPPAIEMAD